METTSFGKIKKHLPKIAILLLVLCAAQGWVIYRYVVHRSTDSQPWGYTDTIPSFTNKPFANQTKKNRDFFNRFFSNNFFSNNTGPFEEMQQFRKQFEESMKNDTGNMFGNSWSSWFGSNNSTDTGGIDIRTIEKKNSYVITVEIPNLKDNKLNININQDGVSIKGEFSQTVEKKDRWGNVIGKSEREQSISRQIPIAGDADYDHAKIDHKGDKVIITIPKRSV